MINLNINIIEFYEFLVLFIPLSLFFIGLVSLVSYKKNLILLLIGLEVILLGINICFLISSLLIDDIEGYISTMFILVVAGSEISIGLALTILFYRLVGVVYIESLFFLKS